MLRCETSSVLVLPSKYIFWNKTLAEACLQGSGMGSGSPKRWRRREFGVAGTEEGSLWRMSQKCQLCHKVYFILACLEKPFSPAKEGPLFPLSSQPLNRPRVALRGDGDGKAQVTGVQFRWHGTVHLWRDFLPPAWKASQKYEWSENPLRPGTSPGNTEK